MTTLKGKWIYSPQFDLAFILAPAFIITGLVVLCPSLFKAAGDVPLWAWVLFVMLIDVSHVYSTLFRTYLDKQEMKERPMLYMMTPVICFVAGIILYSFGAAVFWTVLAYLAVFHFVRQQYGFMMIYSKKEGARQAWAHRLDRYAIYAATLYPLIYWHTHMPRKFNWFVEGDFFTLPYPMLDTAAFALYLIIFSSYVLKEIFYFTSSRTVSFPKNLLLFGTALSWYTGIVTYNGDMAFTLTNVVSHGVPYIALVWIYAYRKWSSRTSSAGILSWFLKPRRALGYILILLCLAYFEESLWDAFVWKDHPQLFPQVDFTLSTGTLSWLVPLLALPQATHYVLDAFIWKVRRPDDGMKLLLSSEAAS